MFNMFIQIHFLLKPMYGIKNKNIATIVSKDVYMNYKFKHVEKHEIVKCKQCRQSCKNKF